MNKYYPFNTLFEQVNHIKNGGVEISFMNSFAGNTKVSKMIYEITQKLFNKESRDVVVKNLKAHWKLIEKKHPEINKSNIRKNIFWYLDGACIWVKYEEIGMDEIKGR